MSGRILFPVVRAWPATDHLATRNGDGSRSTQSRRVPLEIIPRGRLLRAAIAEPLRRWTIVLFLEGGGSRRATEDIHLLGHLVPWFSALPRYGVALAQLRRHGLTVLTATEEDVARQLFRDIRRGHERIHAAFYTPQGRRSW